jgi:protein involved in polysaccharide export with SLBB domain
LKGTIVAAGFTLIIFENQLRVHGFDSVVAKSLGAVKEIQVVLTPVFGTADKRQGALDPVGQSAAVLSTAIGVSETPNETFVAQIEGAPPLAAIVQTAAVAAPVETLICDQGGSRSASVVPGDVIQLRYFEKSAVALDQGGSSDTADIVFERLDLSGSFTVGVDGDLSLPAVGYIGVLGRTLPCIEALAARAAFDRLRVNGTVTANFVARPQISLQGEVRSPGTYAFTPGLTVARLLAQAGSIGQDDPASRMRRIELQARESELRRNAQSLSLVQRRLEAALSDNKVSDFTTESISGTGGRLAQERIGAERMALEAERDAVQYLRDKEQAELSALDLRIAAAERQLDAITDQHSYFSERNAYLDGLHKKGITTSDTLVASQIRLMDTEFSLLEKTQLVSELRSERDVFQRSIDVASADRRKLKIDALRDVIASLESIDGQIATVVAQLEDTAGGNYTMLVSIERTGIDGTVQIETNAATRILPGDFVTVVAKAEDSGPVEMSQTQNDEDPDRQKMVMK